MPTIRIPLRPGDADAVLDMQLPIDAVYENGGYEDTDYWVDPVPPLSTADAEWAAGVLRGAQRRCSQAHRERHSTGGRIGSSGLNRFRSKSLSRYCTTPGETSDKAEPGF